MIGLSGAHGVGKTTLARAVSEQFELPMVKSNAAAIMGKWCVAQDVEIPFLPRLALQTEILEDHERQVRALNGQPFISDRTPLDMLVYTQRYASKTSYDSEDLEKLIAYAKRCFGVMNRHYAMVVLVQPGIPYVECEKRPAYDEKAITSFTRELNDMMVKSAFDFPCYVMTPNTLDLQTRVATVMEVWENTLLNTQKHKKHAVIH